MKANEEKPLDRFVRAPAVVEMTGLPLGTIYSEMDANRFPKSVRISARSVAWRYGELLHWMQNRPLAKDAPLGRVVKPRKPGSPSALKMARTPRAMAPPIPPKLKQRKTPRRQRA